MRWIETAKLRSSLIYACISVLIVSTFMVGSIGAAQQYFPTDGAEARYQLSWQTHYLTTRISTDKFNVYTTLVVNQTFALPVWMDENMAPNKTGYTSLVNDTTVELVISYANFNSTHLVRSRFFALEDRTISYGEFGIFYFKNQTTFTYQQHSSLQYVKYVQKSGFITDFNAMGILDYTNKDVLVGGTLMPGYVVMSIGTNILALWSWHGAPGNTNTTIVVDGSSGQTLSSTHCIQYTSYGGAGYQFVSLTSTLVVTPTSTAAPFLPEYAYWIICAGLGVLAISLGGMLAKSKRK